MVIIEEFEVGFIFLFWEVVVFDFVCVIDNVDVMFLLFVCLLLDLMFVVFVLDVEEFVVIEVEELVVGLVVVVGGGVVVYGLGVYDGFIGIVYVFVDV